MVAGQSFPKRLGHAPTWRSGLTMPAQMAARSSRRVPCRMSSGVRVLSRITNSSVVRRFWNRRRLTCTPRRAARAQIRGRTGAVSGAPRPESETESRLEHNLEQRLARSVLPADVVAPHVDQQHVRQGHREQSGLFLKSGVVRAALSPVRALRRGRAARGKAPGGAWTGRQGAGAGAPGGRQQVRAAGCTRQG